MRSLPGLLTELHGRPLLQAQSRCAFLWARQQRADVCPDRARARERLGQEASLAAFPLLVAVLALPLTGLLWNLLLHAHWLL